MVSLQVEGLKVVIEYEQKQGRTVFDVHSDKTYGGMDLLSVDLKGKELPRLIEVKASKSEDSIPDCYNSEFIESFSGLRFRATHLYAVNIKEAGKPKLAIIPKKEIDKYAREHIKLTNIRLARGITKRIKEFRVKLA
ncbi:MAG: hypothetical protein WC634_01575 [archaeon]